MPAQVRITANFQKNLEEIRQFLKEQAADSSFDDLIQHLFDAVIPNLALFPAMGRDFQSRAPQS